jgi:predicted DCC family thiol-disulfide oxidoreductase YuxK
LGENRGLQQGKGSQDQRSETLLREPEALPDVMILVLHLILRLSFSAENLRMRPTPIGSYNSATMTKKLKVFYDGACPMCRKEIGIYQAADKAGKIDWINIAAPIEPADLPLAREQLLARFHVQRPDGELVSGARGFIEVWRHIPKWRWLGYACSLPGVPVILEIGYHGFLKMRPAIQKIFR